MKKTSFRKLLAMPSYSIKSVFMEYLKLLKLPYYDECCSNNNGYPVRYNEGNIERFDGTDWQVVPTGSSTIPLSSITGATQANAIYNGNSSNGQLWSWNGYSDMLTVPMTLQSNRAVLKLDGGAFGYTYGILQITDSNFNPTPSQIRAYITGISPSLPDNQTVVGMYFGKSQSSYNTGAFSFKYISDANIDNFVSFQIYGADNILTYSGRNRVGIAGVIAPTAPLDINGNTIRLRTAKTPASASDTGNQGDIAWDTDYMYVCVATNTWKRTPLSTW